MEVGKIKGLCWPIGGNLGLSLGICLANGGYVYGYMGGQEYGRPCVFCAFSK